MKAISFAILFFTNGHCISPSEVYVCDSKDAIRYHLKSTCRGLSNCTYRIVKTTVEKAKKEGKTLCHWESDKK